MPFDTKPTLFKCGSLGSSVVLPELEEVTKKTRKGEKKLVNVKFVNQSKKSVGDFRQFDLKTQLQAGVPLKQVNTIMYGSGVVNVADIPELSENPNENPTPSSGEGESENN